MIPYGRQEIQQCDIDAVVKVLRSDFLTQGPVVPLFERAVANKTGAQHAVAVNSATSALHLACMALGLGPGDLFWTTPITFVASANCALYCGAEVDFVDIDPVTGNMSPSRLASKLNDAANKGRLPKVLVPVHMAGAPCDMASLSRVARKYNVRIIEDASHAIGAKYQGLPVGNSAHSDITVFSFHPVKIITTAEGGMVVTNSEDLAHKISRLRSHGITRDPQLMAGTPDGPWYYEQIELGYNYRMTDIQAALGLSQLDRLDEYVSRRHAIAEKYDEAFAGLPLTTPVSAPDSYSAFHLYIIRLNAGIDRRLIYDRLLAQGISANVHYIPVHLQPFYRQLGFRRGNFPLAESWYDKVITLPLFPRLTESMQETVIESVFRAFE
jgi:UDP-4-amino-4,6-dideoxy-N-acetyl-beta-L-altrosamine transaminase